MRRRRWRRAVGAAVAAVLVAGGCSGGDGLADRLRARIDRVGRPERFAIEYRAGGTRVVDCFLPNRAFTVSVDRRARALAVTTGRERSPSALVIGDNVYLHRTLFSGDALPTEWLRVPPRATRDVKASVERAVGTDLAGYLFAEGFPPTGEETALAVLDVATDVESLEAQDVHGRRLEGYRVIVDPERFAAEAALAEDPDQSARGAAAVTPVVQVWVGAGGEVGRLSVREQASGRSDPDARGGGWTTDYLPLDDGLDVPAVIDATSASELDVSGLRPASRGSCELEIGSGEDHG